MNDTAWTQALVELLALALRLEDEGQYNLAKLARATADALARRAAYGRAYPADGQDLNAAVTRVVDGLAGLGVEETAITAFRRGAAALAAGRLPLIDDTPHPYVCRTCGTLVLGTPVDDCPTCHARPDTFQWFPPVYWLQALDPPAALERLRHTPQEVATLLEGLTEEDMNRRPPNGGWAIRHILTHLRDAQDVLEFRLGLFAQQENPLLESKAVFEWATSQAERPPTAHELLGMYQATRARILETLEHLPPADWWRAGRHEEFGTVTLGQQASYFATHEITHLPQLAALRDWLLPGSGD